MEPFMSLTQAWERLFIGGIGDAEALAESNSFGIATVITLCRERVRKEAPRVNYLYFPLRDARPIPGGRFDAIIDALWESIRWGTVLVHSLAGSNRAPVIAAAWMHVVGCKNIDVALAEIGMLRTIQPNPILLKSVKELL
jgi:protein-tyrosine phosphatase